jgi:hypothetical protein
MFICRLAVCLLALAVGVSGAAGAQTAFALRAIVEENTQTSLGTFRGLIAAGVTRQGQVFFTAERIGLRDGDDQALFVWDDGRITRLVGRNDRVPGGRIRAILRASIAPQSASDRVFLATVSLDGGGEQRVLFAQSGSRLQRLLAVGELLGPGRFLSVNGATGSLQVNARGDVLLSATLDRNGNGLFDRDVDAVGLFLHTGGAWVSLAYQGLLRSGGRVFSVGFTERALNDRGRVAWRELLDQSGTLDAVVIVSDRGQGRREAREGDTAPGGRLLLPQDPVLNEAGNVAFAGVLDRNSDGRIDARDETAAFLFRPENSRPLQILLRSGEVERGLARVESVEALNASNQAAVTVRVDTDQDGQLEASDDVAVYVASTSGASLLVRGGGTVPPAGEIRGGLLRLGGFTRLNSRGEGALWGFIDANGDGGFDGASDERVLLAASSTVPVFVGRDGQTVTLTINGGQLLDVRGPEAITDAGAIVFTALLDRDFDGAVDAEVDGRILLLAVPLSR